MRIYVVIGVFQGVVSDVSAFIDPGAAYTEQQRLSEKYGIERATRKSLNTMSSSMRLTSTQDQHQ